MSQLRKISVKADGYVRLLFIFFIVNSDPSGSGSVLASQQSNSLKIVFFRLITLSQQDAAPMRGQND